MARRFYLAVAVFTAVIGVGAIVFAQERVSSKMESTIIGQIGSMSTMDGTLTVKEDGTDKERQLKADQRKLKAAGIQEGYSVEISTAGDKATRIRVLGMPMKAEPEPHQIIKIVR